MSRECWQNFHQEEEQRNGNPQPSHDAHRGSLFHEPEGEAGGEPPQGGGHRADFRYRNKQRITKKESDDRRHSNPYYCNGGRQKDRMNRSKAFMNGPATAVGDRKSTRLNSSHITISYAV